MMLRERLHYFTPRGFQRNGLPDRRRADYGSLRGVLVPQITELPSYRATWWAPETDLFCEGQIPAAHRFFSLRHMEGIAAHMMARAGI